MMVDWAYVGGMGDDNGDPDHDIHDPDAHCGPTFGEMAVRNPSLRGFGPRNSMRAFRTLPISRTEPVTCKLCGATNLKWRWVEGDKWILVHNERVHPGNYKPEHVCPTSADGFEEVE